MADLRRTYFEDLVLNAVIETPGLTVTEAHLTLYSGLTGDVAVEPGVVPENLPLCLATGLGWRVPHPPLAVMAFLALEWRALEPIRVGDTIHSRAWTATKRPLREGGLVIEQREVINQRGELVQQGRMTILVERRPAASAEPRRAKEVSA